MIVFPNAKINIGLHITERRPDGYHNLETVFYPLMIKDALEVIESKELNFQSSGIPIPGNNGSNLCLQAYRLINRDFNMPPVSIHLHKHIPIGAGLGGGSADAAFFIKVMNETFNLSLNEDDMMNYARQLGADCAFFIKNKPVYAFEKGDRFEPVKLDLSAYHIVLVMPSVHVSTAEAYGGIKPAAPQVSVRELIQQPINEWKRTITNDFENHIFEAYPVIRLIKEVLYNAGALYASMSGSGASVFGIFNEMPDLSVLEADNQVFYNL
ncbi:4-(cytidine 5'-diphospho)-2-C-methyl-D-erythritol kinase [Mucilaginibacter sp. PAMB04168]|uniref:4-(cytidine 5'-diphospho)-2-C-methyl-D-erythritol kinase n=1 Tax=Mucilaginibacter sp. PAMB04168 TaxID=3138567 RepID=UPI0031F63D1E